MTFCLWGRGVELLVDAVTMALTGQIKIYTNLLADVGVRYPGTFAVTAAVTRSFALGETAATSESRADPKLHAGRRDHSPGPF